MLISTKGRSDANLAALIHISSKDSDLVVHYLLYCVSYVQLMSILVHMRGTCHWLINGEYMKSSEALTVICMSPY